MPGFIFDVNPTLCFYNIHRPAFSKLDRDCYNTSDSVAFLSEPATKAALRLPASAKYRDPEVRIRNWDMGEGEDKDKDKDEDMDEVKDMEDD